MAESTLVAIGASSCAKKFASNRPLVAQGQIVAICAIVTGSAHAIGEKPAKWQKIRLNVAFSRDFYVRNVPT